MVALSVVSVADRAGFYTFAAALRDSDHFATLAGPGPFTVFAPTDEAFKKFSVAALDKLLRRDRALLHIVLGYHIAAGKARTGLLVGKRYRAVMQTGGNVLIDGKARGLKVNAARFVKPDLEASNGVVHGIDGLLWPREARAPAAVA